MAEVEILDIMRRTSTMKEEGGADMFGCKAVERVKGAVGEKGTDESWVFSYTLGTIRRNRNDFPDGTGRSGSKESRKRTSTSPDEILA